MIVLALSGGVDSSVAAALALEKWPLCQGVGVTLGLWGGERHGNSCSTADGNAALDVARVLGVEHEYLDWTADFEAVVVRQFTDYAAAGKASNPCIECNKVFKAERLFAWAVNRGATKVVTGHYARVVDTMWGPRIGRGKQLVKDQSYVLCGFEPEHIKLLELPLGDLDKEHTRKLADDYNLGTADKRDSMGLCFSPGNVLANANMPLLPIRDEQGRTVGQIRAGEAVVGQRKGLGVSGFDSPRYVTDIGRTAVQLGSAKDLLDPTTPLAFWRWVGGVIVDVPLKFQVAAHGDAVGGSIADFAVVWDKEHTRVSPGQVVVAYAPVAVGDTYVDVVVGFGEAAGRDGWKTL